MLKFTLLLLVLLLLPSQLVGEPRVLSPLKWTARQIWAPGEKEANLWTIALIASRAVDRYTTERAFGMGWTESSPIFPKSSLTGRSAVGFSITFGETALVRRMMKSHSRTWRTVGRGYALGRAGRESFQAWQNYRLVGRSIEQSKTGIVPGALPPGP